MHRKKPSEEELERFYLKRVRRKFRKRIEYMTYYKANADDARWLEQMQTRQR